MAVANFGAVKNCYLFKEMTDAEISSLAGLFAEKRIGEGLTVFLEHMPGESLFLIRKGIVRISRMISEGDEKTLVILGPEDVFGEMAILDGGPRSATARVIEEASLLSLNRSDFETFCDKNPRLGLRLLSNIVRVFSQRVRGNSEDYRTMLRWSLGEKP
jgi:CRP-like cAMP-binding protein